ncbi:uncharacterized protein LOC134762740 [Penaeus indicus]|uniref:uncharacterized protein LOC134762740 n=1 Tax=Penaeus indicus TaxID=29960 RepID=UPI00300D4AFE
MKYEREFELEDNVARNDELPATKQAKSSKSSVKSCALRQTAERWNQKSLHGKYPLRCQQADVDQTATHQWLRSSGLKAETESFILAAQDQSLFTRNYQANILKNGTNEKCRFCDTHKETIDHLISGCPVLATNEYKNRHDRVGKYLHWTICNSYNIKTCEHWYEHKPEPVVEGENATLLWDFSIHTDRTIQTNRPNIIIKDFKEKTCLLIDTSVPCDQNIAHKEFDKLSKYKDLEIEIQKMWSLKATTVPVIVGALGMIKKQTQKHLDKIPAVEMYLKTLCLPQETGCLPYGSRYKI